jgi:cytoskeletal protein RodZ
MLRPLYILKRLAVLNLGLAFAAGAQTQPSKSAPQTPPAKSPPQAPAKSTPPAAAPGKAPAATPGKAPAKAAAPAKKAQAPAPKPAAPKPKVAQKPSKPAKAPAKAAEETKKEETPKVVSVAGKRRDPFLALFSGAAGPPLRLPPGKAGLQVSTLRVDGVVRSTNGMLAVITNPQGRTYFLRQGDRLFDGRVEQINMDAVTFAETGKDPFGKTIERTVVKRIYPSAGEQQ